MQGDLRFGFQRLRTIKCAQIGPQGSEIQITEKFILVGGGGGMEGITVTVVLISEIN